MDGTPDISVGTWEDRPTSRAFQANTEVHNTFQHDSVGGKCHIISAVKYPTVLKGHT